MLMVKYSWTEGVFSTLEDIFAEFTSPLMLRAVLVELTVQGLLGKPMREEPDPVQSEGLSKMVIGYYLAAANGFEVTRAVTRSQGKSTPQVSVTPMERVLRVVLDEQAEPPLPAKGTVEIAPLLTIMTTWTALPVEIVYRPRKRKEQSDSPSRIRDCSSNLRKNHRVVKTDVSAGRKGRLKILSGQNRSCSRGDKSSQGYVTDVAEAV